MTTAEQIRAVKLNAHHSPEPASPAREQASFEDDTTDDFSHHNESFYFLEDEADEKFWDLHARLEQEHQPQTETARILVRRMADHEWLRTRALRYQQACFAEDQHVLATEQFALYMRYQTTHERAFYKAFKEFQSLRAQREKSQIGFESQKHKEATPGT